jgi:exonuclease SbcC
MLKAVTENELGFTQSIAHAKGQLEELTAEGKALNEDLAPLATLKADLPLLEKYAEARRNLPAIEERVKANEASLANLASEVATTTAERDEAEAAMEKINGTDVLLLETQASTIETRIKNYRGSLEKSHSERGALESKIQSLQQAETERTALWSQKAPKAAEMTHWQTLVRAFGRDGIPALIIENAVPELERISNEILGQMSNGQHSLRFETQRELKSKAGMAETLDIIVSDWMGARPYETFSGGEQLRIDFAIRFALAELLANRAGSRIEWLVVDEGLGSQDSEHRSLVLEAIRSVADRFRKVLVITHIEEAQGVFPQQIRFERNSENVEVTVS